MAIQIVMNRTGDSRHRFDPNDGQELARAEQGFTAAFIVRPERGRDGVLPQTGWRLIGPSHLTSGFQVRALARPPPSPRGVCLRRQKSRSKLE